MAMSFAMRARNPANSAYVAWVATCDTDAAGDQAPGGPSAILAGTAFATEHWGSRTIDRFEMRSRNAANNAYLSWISDGAPDPTGTFAPGGPSAILAGSAVVVARHEAGNAPVPARDVLQVPTGPNTNQIVWPLTYDEEDVSGYSHLTRTLGSAITASGFYGNGVDSRLLFGTDLMPTWQDAANESFSLFARVTPGIWSGAAIEALLSLGANGSDQPKIELCKLADSSNAAVGQLALRIFNGSIQTIRMQRLGWRFEFRVPETLGAVLPFSQALMFLDNTTLLVAGHWNDIQTWLYRFDLTTGECTGKATTTEFQHIGGLGKYTDGSGTHVWACYNFNFESIELDLPRSFLCGEIHIKARWSHPPLQANAGISFLTTGGQDYVLLSQFANDGVTQVFVWVFLRSQMSAPVDPFLIGAGGRVARYDIGQTIQSTTVRTSDNRLYATRNRAQGVAPGSGWGNIQSYDLATAIAAAPGNDSTILSPILTVDTPSQFPEGIDFRPSDNRCWMNTEGLAAAGDLREWSGAIWSGDLSSAAVPTEILVDFNGATNTYEVRQEGRLFGSFALTPSTAPNRLSIGANPNAAAGWNTGFAFDTLIRAVALKDRAFTAAEITSLRGNAGETNTLVAYAVGLTNADAEAGSATGWTDELAGLLKVRSASPAPFQGSFYFDSGNSVNNRSRERFTLAAITGFSSIQVDEQAALQQFWGREEWQQSSFDGTTDPGSCGFRTNDAAVAQLVLATGTEVTITPSLTWRKRSHAVDLPAPTRGIDVLQHRTRTSGVNVDCYVDVVTSQVLSQEHERGTTPIAVTTLDDSSATNTDLTPTGGPLSVKGPMGSDFGVAFGIGRAFTGGAAAGPHTTFTGTDWTWEAMVYLSGGNAAGSIPYIIGNPAGTDSDPNNNTVWQITIGANGQPLGFWEEGAGVNHTLLVASTYRLPFKRWVHLGFRGVTNGANRDLFMYENGVLVGSDSAVKATGGVNRIVQVCPVANAFIGKMAYMRISNIARAPSTFVAAAANPAANIVNDANTTGLYLCQGRS